MAATMPIRPAAHAAYSRICRKRFGYRSPTNAVDTRSRDRLLELDAGVPDVVEAASRVFLQAPPQQPLNTRRRVRRQPSPVGLATDHRSQYVRHRGRVERMPSAQGLEPHAAVRPD